MKRITLILLLVANILSSAYASTAGTTLADFLKLETDARSAAMGGAFTAGAEGAIAVYWNPAGLVQTKNTELSFTHFDYVAGINYENTAVAYPIGKGTLGCDIRLLYAEDQRRNLEGDKLGAFMNYNSAVSIAYGSRVSDTLYCGAAIKAIHMKLDTESGAAVGIDVGTIWQAHKKLKAGVVLQNFGDKMRFAGDTASLPTTIRIGMSYAASAVLNISSDLKVPFEGESRISIGTEYKPYDFLFIRAGYCFRETGNKLGVNDGLSLGIGFKVKRYTFDYAFVPFGEFDTTQRVTLGMQF